MWDKMKCPLCFSVGHESVCEPGDGVMFVCCDRCGRFKITEDAVGYWFEKYSKNQSSRSVANASSWAHYYCNEFSTINDDDLKRCEDMRVPSFNDRADLLLKFISRKTAHIGQLVEFKEYEILVATWSYDTDETHALLNYLFGEGRIQLLKSEDAAIILANGWKHLEKLREKNPLSQQGFVAMWFNDELENAYTKAISPAIVEAGYRPHRVDFGEHNQKIDDEIIVQIRRSKFVVADFTGHRGGVYYEAGFGHGLGLEVFFTCRRDHVEDLHFDIRQYNCVLWENARFDEFRQKLARRIEAVLGKGNASSTI
ncbi:MAG: hypothetical protein RDU30_03490 [Desulfovibrionaceae bacterium]|nr:hypothetical protein [Desulfovibrionaceae bacterium]